MTVEDPEIIHPGEIKTPDRLRKEYGDIDSLVLSIKEFGIIQPIVLTQVDGKIQLVAGGRRLAALRKLNTPSLKHGTDFVWRYELSTDGDEVNYRLKAVELEENLRRKDMTWQEQVTAKEMLLRMMTSLHGAATVGARTREERRTGESQGFGVRKLAAMLGESPATVSRDLQIARAIAIAPSLRTESSKDGALKKATAMVVKQLITSGQVKASAVPVNELSYRILVFCDSEAHQAQLLNEFLQEGLKCQLVIV